MTDELVERCKEIIAWHETGDLKGDVLRTFARSMPSYMGGDYEGSDLRRAETVTLLALCDLVVSARLSQAGAGGVVVKPLEWRDGRDEETVFPVVQIANGLVGPDYMVLGPTRHYLYEVLRGNKIFASRNSEDEAKAAAQADYEARIRSALAPSPSAGEPFGWVVGSVFFNEDPGALLGKQAVFATPPAPVQPTASVETVAVKRLQWNPYRAETEFGYFHIDDQTDRPADELKGRPPFLLTGTRLNLSRHHSLEEARGAAQAEFDRRVLASLTPAPRQGDGHPDDLAVDRFAVAMKAKLAKKRAEGRGGWEDKDYCDNDNLSTLLRHHVEKGDPVDVGNFAMMIHQRGERIGK